MNQQEIGMRRVVLVYKSDGNMESLRVSQAMTRLESLASAFTHGFDSGEETELPDLYATDDEKNLVKLNIQHYRTGYDEYMVAYGYLDVVFPDGNKYYGHYNIDGNS